MFPYWLCFVIFVHVIKVVYKSAFYLKRGLTHILFFASQASYAIYEIRAPARDVYHGLVLQTCDCGLDTPTFIKFRAVSANFSVTKVKTPFVSWCQAGISLTCVPYSICLFFLLGIRPCRGRVLGPSCYKFQDGFLFCRPWWGQSTFVLLGLAYLCWCPGIWGTCF